MFHRIAFLPFLCAGMAYGQSAPNSITVTASRNSTLQPDQVVFAVNVASALTNTMSDVLAAVQGAGITATNFSNVTTVQQYISSTQQYANSLQWTFSLTVPFTNMKSTVATLNGLQLSAAQNKNGLSVSFSVQGTQVSAQAQQAQTCPASGLISDARTQAQNIASASSMTVGSILAMSTSVSTSTPGANSLTSAIQLPVCSLTVKFALGGF
jgi:uncharacterized protein YggE